MTKHEPQPMESTMPETDINARTAMGPGRLPEELWMLWNPKGGVWVVSIDDAPDGPTYLVAFGQPEAEAAAKHQEDYYGVDGCVAVWVL